MGFSETIAALGKDFIWVAIALDTMDGENEAYSDFLGFHFFP